MLFLKQFFLYLCFTTILITTSCNQAGDQNFIETEDKDFIAAKQKMREGDFEQALEHFHKVIEKHSYSPESHLEAGVIYLQQENEPLISIYHLNQYLQQNPNSREAPLVGDLIISAKKQFASELPGNPLKNSVSRMELLETIATLKKQVEELNQENLQLSDENMRLKQQLSGAHNTMRGIISSDRNTSAHPQTQSTEYTEPENQDNLQTSESENTLPTEEVQQPEIPQTYVVQSGDSLYAISLKVYGDAEHIQAIFQANRNILKSVNDLKPGQVLKIP